jgi:hypothetical protein
MKNTDSTFYSPGCGKALGSRCIAQGHMVECSVHPGVYSLPGNECATCAKVRDAAERKAAAEAAKAEKAEAAKAKKAEAAGGKKKKTK